MQDWEQWIHINKPKIKHIANFEERFVREILTKIPEISPNDVIAQYHFQDFNGGNRYIDFCIKNDSKGYFVSIELDGKWKEQELAELLERQNIMMASRVGTLLRFANSTWLGKSSQVIQTIRKVLEEQHKAFKSKVRTEDLEFKLKEQQQELLRLKQQNNTDEVKQLTSMVNNLAKQLNEQKGNGNNAQDINTIMLGLAQQISSIKAPSTPIQTKPSTTLYIGIGLVVAAIGLGAFIYNTKSINTGTAEAASASVPLTSSPAYTPESTYKHQASNNTILSHEASNHVGEFKIVCGYVAQIKAIQSRTYLNLGSSYPNQDMAIVIWPDDIDKVRGVLDYGGRQLCVEGEITTYKDTPQIALRNTAQIISSAEAR